MNDDDLKAELDRLVPFEGRVNFLYLDNATRPNVTVGVGYLIASIDEACALPFFRVSDGLPATRAEITADFIRVRSMRGGMVANAYKGGLRLAESAIDAEGFRRLRAFLDGLPAVFPGFDGFPRGVKMALLDLAWNVGLGAEATESHPATGLRGWTHLRAACNSVPPNWPGAAANCRTANPGNNSLREKRNDWRSQMFIDAEVAA
jgi:hypothetical protein